MSGELIKDIENRLMEIRMKAVTDKYPVYVEDFALDVTHVLYRIVDLIKESK